MTEMRYKISRDIARYSDTDDPSHHWTLTVDGDTSAELWTSTETGEIENIETKPSHQRRGYATALYRHAASETQIFHAPESHRSVEGHTPSLRQWAVRLRRTTRTATASPALPTSTRNDDADRRPDGLAWPRRQPTNSRAD